LIYFKYDFGYEVGLVLPGEGKNMKGSSSEAPAKRPPLQLPGNEDEVEFPIIHEPSEITKQTKKIRWESESELSEFEALKAQQRSEQRSEQRLDPSPSSVSTTSPAHWTIQPGESGSKQKYLTVNWKL
jgi:titin